MPDVIPKLGDSKYLLAAEFFVFNTHATVNSHLLAPRVFSGDLGTEQGVSPAADTSAPFASLSSAATDATASKPVQWRCGGRGCKMLNDWLDTRCAACGAFKPILSEVEKRGVYYNSVHFTRRYGSIDLPTTETWIAEALEIVIKEQFGDERESTQLFFILTLCPLLTAEQCCYSHGIRWKYVENV